jgi:hypothetical protein
MKLGVYADTSRRAVYISIGQPGLSRTVARERRPRWVASAGAVFDARRGSKSAGRAYLAACDLVLGSSAGLTYVMANGP